MINPYHSRGGFVREHARYGAANMETYSPDILEIDVVPDFYQWCAGYGAFWRGRDGTQAWQRLNIGLYQFAQAMKWQGRHDMSYCQQLCAMILHVMTAATDPRVRAPVCERLPMRFSGIERHHRGYDPHKLVVSMTNLIQLYYYRTGSLSISRSRMAKSNPEVIANHTADLIVNTCQLIPSHRFVPAMEWELNGVVDGTHTQG